MAIKGQFISALCIIGYSQSANKKLENIGKWRRITNY